MPKAEISDRGSGMDMVKLIAVCAGAVLLGFVMLGILLESFRAFLWVGIIGWVVYAIVVAAMRRRSS
jgi:hypothetical protein